jgi:hypothetical protein
MEMRCAYNFDVELGGWPLGSPTGRDSYFIFAVCLLFKV